MVRAHPRRVICKDCNKFCTVYGGNVEQRKDYLCGACRPKLFDDEMLERIILEFMEEYNDVR